MLLSFAFFFFTVRRKKWKEKRKFPENLERIDGDRKHNIFPLLEGMCRSRQTGLGRSGFGPRLPSRGCYDSLFPHLSSPLTDFPDIARYALKRVNN